MSVAGIVLGLGLAAISPRGAQAAPPGSRPEPFLAAYVRFSELFEARDDAQARMRSLTKELDRMKACGINTVLPYATDTSGRALYPSKIISEHVYGDWDPLVLLVQEAHRRGLRVFPVQVALACGGDKPGGVSRKHPEWALRDAKGNPTGHISPANADARRWVASVSRELVTACQPDGLLLDYLRFPSQPVQLDPAAATLHKLPTATSDAAAKREFQAFKEEVLTEQARMIAEAAREAKPDLKIALYSWGPFVVTNHAVAQNWGLWVQRGYIDVVNISGYCYTDNYGARYMQEFAKRVADSEAINRASGRPAQLTFALGIDTSHGRIKRAAEVGEYLTTARENGATGFAAFTWGYLKPFYAEVSEADYFRKFAGQAR
jgi:uncharacterized lipoprotein YddW (UPF0748 family)